MVKLDLFSRMAAVWRRMRGGSRRKRDRILLMFRLENTSLLVDLLGQHGLAQLRLQISMRFSQLLRPHDPVDIDAPGYFVISLRTGSEVEAMRIALRLQDMCQQSFRVGGMSVVPVLTGALVQHREAGADEMAQLAKAARDQLLRLGPDGLGRIVLSSYDPQHRPVQAMATVAEAAAAGEIEAYFQPQICCNSGVVKGFEALARWNHPARGVLNPGYFAPGMSAVDQTALTGVMLRQCLHALREWDKAGWDIPTVSLNVAQTELSDPGFADAVLWELDRQGIAARRLVIEVLESVGPINSCDTARRNLSRLAVAGCPLDLDDFGTGYASLDSIRKFGVHRIKIDRSFVTDCHSDPVQQRMVLGILAMAERLGIATLAEGVETAEEHSFLAQIGCDQVQGFAIARPMPLGQTHEFMDSHLNKQQNLPNLGGRRAS